MNKSEQNNYAVNDDVIELSCKLLRSYGYVVIPPGMSFSVAADMKRGKNTERLYRFGKFVFNAELKSLNSDVQSVRLTELQSRTLEILLMHWNEPVPIDTICAHVWPGCRHVPTSNLYHYISYIRRVLKPDQNIRLVSIRSEAYRLGYLVA